MSPAREPAAPSAVDPLLSWRREFPTVERTLHFASHTLGAMPRGVERALAAYAETWRTRGIRAWEEGWFALPTETGNVLAAILSAAPGTVSMCENVTLAQAVALSAIEFRPPRDRLVCTAEDFPSVLYLYEGLERRGARVVRVPARDGRRIEPADVAAAIDERTAVVALSHVLFRTGQIVELEPVIARAREAGARTLVDAYQAVGTVPMDVGALGVDFVTGGSVKWLCGGPGAGWLYASPRAAAELRPAITGWMAHEDPFAFDPGPMRWHAGPRRFWTGTPAVPAFAAARVGYDIVAEIGVEAIRRKSLRQTGRMIARAEADGFRVVSPREEARRGGTVALDVPNAARVCEALLASDALLDHRPGVGLRLAPHFYTADDEVEEIMARVREEVARAAR